MYSLKNLNNLKDDSLFTKVITEYSLNSSALNYLIIKPWFNNIFSNNEYINIMETLIKNNIDVDQCSIIQKIFNNLLKKFCMIFETIVITQVVEYGIFNQSIRHEKYKTIYVIKFES